MTLTFFQRLQPNRRLCFLPQTHSDCRFHLEQLVYLDPQLETTRWLDEPLADWKMDGLTYWRLYSDHNPKGLANMSRTISRV